MKVVLFCGGLGTRIREHSERIPKPLVKVGNRPILWHLMRYYAHFGHKEFILCLGYGGDQIREFFLNYNECLSNDFVLSPGRKDIKLLTSDVQDWRITFVDTELHSNIGERLLRVRRFLAGESAFLANYSDGLTDLPLDRHIADFERRGVIASFVAVPPPVSFHSIQVDSAGLATGFQPMRDAGLLINGGFFCLRSDIFDYIQPNEDLIEAFQRLSARRQLAAFRYDGFWQAMDTFKDKMAFDGMHARGECPWMLWKENAQRKQPAPRSNGDAETADLVLDATLFSRHQQSSA
jgi:glucose-1-phosphate cytidylyltransferase